jgi:hypothetical protein
LRFFLGNLSPQFAAWTTTNLVFVTLYITFVLWYLPSLISIMLLRFTHVICTNSSFLFTV